MQGSKWRTLGQLLLAVFTYSQRRRGGFLAMLLGMLTGQRWRSQGHRSSSLPRRY